MTTAHQDLPPNSTLCRHCCVLKERIVELRAEVAKLEEIVFECAERSRSI